MKSFRCLPVFAWILVSALLHAQMPGEGLRHTCIQISQIPPAITAIVPSNALAGGPAFTLVVHGNNFNETSIVQWNGANRTTTCLGSTMLSAMISADDVASAAIVTITVFNPFPGGGTSNPLTFRANNPAPMIFGLNPESTTAGGPAFTLSVNGVNFVPASTVQWNGDGRPTTFISSTRLTAMISAGDLAAAASANITVLNPAPGGGSSGAISFHCDNPVPSIDYINPNSATAGAVGFSLSVYGSGFVNASTVQWNGNSRNTTFISPSQLNALIYASDTAAAGTASITVANPIPGGGVSSSRMFTIMSRATPLSAAGTATPSSLKAGGNALLVVRVSPGSDPASTGINVLADLTAIGGSSSQQLYDDGTHGDTTPGDNSFSLRVTVSSSTSNGKKALPVAVRDAQGRSATTAIQLTVGLAQDQVGNRRLVILSPILIPILSR